MKKIVLLLFLSPVILLSLSFEFEKIDEFAESGDYGEYHRLLIEDNFLYAISHYGFEVNSVNEYGELLRIGIIPIEGDVDGIEKIGNYVFVSVSTQLNRLDEIDSELYKIDVSNPYEPMIVDSIVFPENIKNYKIGTYGAYLGYHKLEEINNNWFYTQLVFMDPITFEEITSYIIHTFTDKLNDNYFMQQRNSGEYIFDIYDYSDIYDIQLVDSVNFESCPTQFLTGHAIDDNTFVLMGYESISLYNISDIHNIEYLSTYNRYGITFPFGDCTKVDNYLLIPSEILGIEVVDITDPQNPTMFDFWEFPIEELTQINPYFISAGEVIYENNHLYIGTFYNGILLMNFFDGTIEYVNKNQCNRNNYTFHDVFNNHLFTTGFSGGLYVYNIEDVTSPTLEMIIFEDLFVTDFRIKNNYIYLTTYSGLDENNYFKVFDISDLANPILLLDELLSGFSAFRLNENEFNNIYICSDVNSQYQEVRKYDIANPENIVQILQFDFAEIVRAPSFFYSGYLYVLANGNEMKDLLIYDGFEEENPELVNQITNFTVSPKIYNVDDYLNISQSYTGFDHFYNLDDPLNPEFSFSTQNSSGWKGCKLRDNVLFCTKGYTVYLYDLEDDPSGELEPFDFFNLNSAYKNITFFSQNDNNYFFCEQLECISTYNYSIETSAQDDLQKPEISLSNYPNPFNPETNIIFSLPGDSNIELDIFNIKGQKIKTLLRDQIEAGEHSITWNGEDASGKKVSSGVYLYKLKVNDDKEIIKKCMLLK